MGEPQHSSDQPPRSRELSAADLARSPAEVDLAAAVPAVVAELGPDAARSFVEFFAAQIRNRNTRAAYFRNAVRFLTWVDRRGLALPRVTTLHVAAYIERLGGTHSAPSVKQHLATLRMLGQFLVVKGVLAENSAAGVRGPKHVVTVGKTPVLGVEDVRRLFRMIRGDTPAAVRDRALLATMLYTFGRVSAVLDLDLVDYYQVGRRMYVRLREKGGRHHEMPLNHRAVEFIDAYVSLLNVGAQAPAGERVEDEKPGGEDSSSLPPVVATAVNEDPLDTPVRERVPLFRTLNRKRDGFTDRRLNRREALAMIKRRCRAAGLGDRFACHTLRATGITAYLKNGGLLEHAQFMAGHAEPKTTKLYDRRQQEVTQKEVERIVF